MATFLNSLKSLKNLKENYLAKSPNEKCLYVRKVHTGIMSTFGCNFMDSNYKPCPKTLMPAYVFFYYFCLLIYTLCYYRNDPFRALQATPATGIIVPGFVIFIIILMPSTRKQYRYLYNFAGDFLYVNCKNSSSNRNVYDRMAIDLVTSTLRVLLLIAVSFTFIICAPTYKNFFTDDREMIIPVVIPFVDPETDDGFYLNILSQLLISAFGAIPISGIEIVTCVLKNTVSLSTALIEDSLIEFKNCLEHNSTFNVERTCQFKTIIMKISDFNSFIINLTDLYYWKFLLQPLFLMYAVVISIYLYLIDGWITGIGCALCCYTQLIILCDIGKAVEDANHAIVNALNQFPFYLLPTKKQEMFCVTLSSIQNGPTVHIGPFAKLNYETATKLTKTIYSYIMLMIRGL